MPHHHGTTGFWEASIPLTLALVVVAVVYFGGWLRLRSVAARLPGWRVVSFHFGLFLIWIATASPIAALHHELLTVHMIQHLLLMTLAPPLIWLGEPVRAFSSGLPAWFANVAVSMLGWPSMQRFGKWFTRPAVCLLASSVALVGWHIPRAFAFTMQSGVWHAVALASFLAIGLLFWWPVIQPWPSLPRSDLSLILYIFFATLPCDVLSGFLVFCDRVVYPDYLSSSHLLGLSALGDQQCAAALMWTCVTIVYFVTGVILTMHLLSPQSLKADDATQAMIRNEMEAA
jgi:cytochrome c oxidase assembly factor CtaG